MTGPRIRVEELVVHVFYPATEQAYGRIRARWHEWRRQLGHAIVGTELPVELPTGLAPAEANTDVVIAGQESRAGERQALLRRRHDVLNLAVGFAGHTYDATRSVIRRSRRSDFSGWVEFDRQWAQLSGVPDDLLTGEARLYLATAADSPQLGDLASLGQATDLRLPPGPRQASWWAAGVATGSGLGVWEVSPQSNWRQLRRIVVLAPPGRDAQLSAWTWSDGPPVIPPFARYLLHAAQLHDLARGWEQDRRNEELRVRAVDAVARLRSARPLDLAAATDLEFRIASALDTLANQRHDAEIAADNMARNIAGGVPDPTGANLFGDDRNLAAWLGAQLRDEARYLEDARDLLRQAREIVRDDQAGGVALATRTPSADTRSVPAADEVDRYFGTAVARALRESAASQGGTVDLPSRRWRRVGPHTGAVLAHIVLERPNARGGSVAHKMMVKVCPGEQQYHDEAGRTARAWLRAPGFAKDHLVGQPLGGYPVGDGSFLMFQELAGSPGDTRTLGELAFPDRAVACGVAIRLVLTEWNTVTEPERRSATVGEYLRMELRDALAEGKSARSWAEGVGAFDVDAQWITVANSGVSGPNPVLMAQEGSAFDHLGLEYLSGFSHGDLHTDNVMASSRDPGPSGIRFIDLSGYEENAPLSRDVVTLLLSTVEPVVRQGLDPVARAQLLDFVVCPQETAPTHLPPAVVDPVRSVYDVIDNIPMAWREEWRLQCLLSLQAQALIHTSYDDLGPHGRWWFFQLAVRAAARFHVEDGERVPESGGPVQVGSAVRAGPFL